MPDRVVRPEYRPDPDLSREEMEQLQREIAGDAIFEDAFDFDPSLDEVLVAGIDQAFLDEKAVSGIVLMRVQPSQDDGSGSPAPVPEVVERAHAVVDLEIPYIPGLLAFREGEAILAAYEELEQEPDLLVVDGSGRIHFREAGIATHIGVMLDIPSIGVAKNLLCGRPREPLDRELAQGDCVAIESDDRVTAADGTVIGYAFQSKQYSGSRTVNPLYVSPGHRVSAETAVNLVEKLPGGHTVSDGNGVRAANSAGGWDYKLPEPTRLADMYVDKVKQRLRDDDQTALDGF